MAPLGNPVVPPVYCSSATSSALMAGHCAGFAAPSMNCLWVMMAGLSGSAACCVPTLPQLSSSQTIRRSSRPLIEKLQRSRQQRREVAGDEHARAGVRELVRQRDLAVERRQVHDAGAGLQRAEEIDGMIRRIAEEQRDRTVLAVAGAKEGAGCDLDQPFEFDITDRPVAKFNRRPRRRTRRPPPTTGRAACRARSDRPSGRLPDRTVRRDGSWMSSAPQAVIPGRCEAANPESRDSRCALSPGLVLTHHPGMTCGVNAAHQAAFDCWASDAKVLPSAARRLSSGAGSSEGSLVSLA